MDECGVAPYVVPIRPWEQKRLQFMILLSALLASLTGLVAGERQPVRAQVELSAQAMAAQVEAAATQSAVPFLASEPTAEAPRLAPFAFSPVAFILLVGAFLSRKQSWLA